MLSVSAQRVSVAVIVDFLSMRRMNMIVGAMFAGVIVVVDQGVLMVVPMLVFMVMLVRVLVRVLVRMRRVFMCVIVFVCVGMVVSVKVLMFVVTVHIRTPFLNQQLRAVLYIL